MRRECISTTRSMKRKHQNLGLFFQDGWVEWVKGEEAGTSTWVPKIVVKQVGCEGHPGVVKDSMAYTYWLRYGGSFLGWMLSRWWFQIFFIFTPPMLTSIFQRVWNHQPVIFLEIWREHKNLKVDQGWYVWLFTIVCKVHLILSSPPTRVMLSGRICQGRGQEYRKVRDLECTLNVVRVMNTLNWSLEQWKKTKVDKVV